MTGSKHLVSELLPNDDQATVTYGDKSKSKVMGFGKVVVTPNITLVNVMFVETLGYNLLSIRALGADGCHYMSPGIVDQLSGQSKNYVSTPIKKESIRNVLRVCCAARLIK